VSCFRRRRGRGLGGDLVCFGRGLRVGRRGERGGVRKRLTDPGEEAWEDWERQDEDGRWTGWVNTGCFNMDLVGEAGESGSWPRTQRGLKGKRNGWHLSSLGLPFLQGGFFWGSDTRRGGKGDGARSFPFGWKNHSMMTR